MKVVLFCGGLGLRMRDVSQRLPKPMIPVGEDPILIHIMKYYAYFGHTEFVLCLGYKGQIIKNYFYQNRDDAFVGRFALQDGSKVPAKERGGRQDWRITFVDTGLHANIGQRLKAVQDFVCQEEIFLANYSDGLSDAPLPLMVSNVVDQAKAASFLCVRPRYSFHVVSWDDGYVVHDIRPVMQSDVWVNGGYFVFRKDIFDYMEDGDELVEEPFQRLIARGELLAYRHEGFWAPMDTFKDRENLLSLVEGGLRPWIVWESPVEVRLAAAVDGPTPVPAA